MDTIQSDSEIHDEFNDQRQKLLEDYGHRSVDCKDDLERGLFNLDCIELDEMANACEGRRFENGRAALSFLLWWRTGLVWSLEIRRDGLYVQYLCWGDGLLVNSPPMDLFDIEHKLPDVATMIAARYNSAV